MPKGIYTRTERHKLALRVPRKGAGIYVRTEKSLNTKGKHWTVKDTSNMKGHIPWHKGKTGVYSEETLQKKREAMTGNKNLLGYKFSEESKRKMRETHTGMEHKLSEEGKKSFREKMSGEKNYRWIKDRTKLVGRHNRNFHDPEYKQWLLKVRNRDGWKCKISNGDCSGRLETHHILGWRSHPELRYEVNNGITLCHFHHPRTRKDEMRLSPYFQEIIKV